MNYNLILDSRFETNNHWQYINCEYKDGYFLSNKKVFGITQELILPTKCKLYFRVNYKIDNISIKNVKIGIQYNKRLECNEKIPKLRKQEFISIVNDSVEQKVKVHLIFESETEINKVYISNPILVDLDYLDKSTWLKSLLDKTIDYRYGYSYQNILDYSECDYFDKANIGTLFKSLENSELEINAKLLNNHYYLAKLDFREVNQLGDIYFKYGCLKSVRIDNQVCLVFKANDELKLYLNIIPNDVLPYQINLKHMMIVDITNLNLMKEDIPYLPFI